MWQRMYDIENEKEYCSYLSYAQRQKVVAFHDEGDLFCNNHYQQFVCYIK